MFPVYFYLRIPYTSNIIRTDDAFWVEFVHIVSVQRRKLTNHASRARSIFSSRIAPHHLSIIPDVLFIM